MHTELISCAAVQPNTGALAVPLGRDSLTVKNSNKRGAILVVWAMLHDNGSVRFDAQSFHPGGIKIDARADTPQNLLPGGIALEPEPQEELAITIAGSNTADEAEVVCMLMHYDSLPGVSGSAIDWPDLKDRMTKLLTVTVKLTADAGVAAYSGDENIDSEVKLLLANRKYALLGATVDTNVPAVTFSAPETGNAKIGIPGDAAHPAEMCEFFVDLARKFRMPLIPVFDSGNRGSIDVGLVQNETDGDVQVTLHLALLR